MRGAKNSSPFVGQKILLLLALIALSPKIAMAAGTSFRFSYGAITDIASSGEILFGSVVLSQTSGYTYLDAFGGVTMGAGISDDGKVIAGNGTTPTSQFYRGWIKQTGGPYIDIGTLGGDRTFVAGMSEDGKYVAGVSFNAQSQYQGFRWAQDTGMKPVDFLPRSSDMSVSGISANGNVVVGTANVFDGRYDPGLIAYDCAGICGPPVARYQQAFMWTESGGSVSLGALHERVPTNDPLRLPPVPYDTNATAISADGKTVVGYTMGPEGFEGFIWRAETGMQTLPGLPDQYGMFFPLATSADGSIVVGGIGGSCGTDCFGGPGAVIWDAQHGTRLLKTVLVDEYGVGNAIGDNLLQHASFISADGLTISGLYGRNATLGSWIVQLPNSLVPEPSTALLVVMAVLSMSTQLRRLSRRSEVLAG
jgi:uncharacterized membrane protein